MFKRSTEDPNRIYICLPGIRFIFQMDAKKKYVGFYHPNLKKVV